MSEATYHRWPSPSLGTLPLTSAATNRDDRIAFNQRQISSRSPGANRPHVLPRSNSVELPSTNGRASGPRWRDPVFRSTDCESRVVVAPGTLGGRSDGSSSRRRAGGEPSGVLPSARGFGQAPAASGVWAAANAAGACIPSAECGRRWL
ncbi:MAG: hypothetical protein QOI48_1618 [Solirubrobacteraceae bacterium]|nr:hypothetical protein [Solirubrobacteraceae bacterium]